MTAPANAMKQLLQTKSTVIARLAEDLLRDAGYPRARIAVSRTVDEAMAHVAHWTVWREAPES